MLTHGSPVLGESQRASPVLFARAKTFRPAPTPAKARNVRTRLLTREPESVFRGIWLPKRNAVRNYSELVNSQRANRAKVASL